MERTKYIDIAKGLGIWCIVLLHYEDGIFPTWLNVTIGSFMITIFYITAGWVMAMKDSPISTKELFWKRMKTLGSPYLYWSTIIVLFDTLLWILGYYNTYYIEREVYKTFVLRGIGTLWFLPALMFGELIWNYLQRKNTLIILLCVILTFVYQEYYHQITLGIVSSTGKIIEAPFHTISNGLNAWLHIASGFVFYKYVWKKYNNSSSQSCIFIGVTFVIFSIANIFGGSTIPIWKYLSGTIGTIFLPLGILLICKGTSSCYLIEYWGINSLSLMVTHYSLVLVLFTILNEYLFNEDFSVGFHGFKCFIYFFASIPIQYLLTIVLNSYFPQLLGRSSRDEKNI